MQACCCRLLLTEKRTQLGSQAAKLRGGLTKLSETGQQVHLLLPGVVQQSMARQPAASVHCDLKRIVSAQLLNMLLKLEEHIAWISWPQMLQNMICSTAGLFHDLTCAC